MTKFILLALILSLPAIAQNADELTLESTTAPTVVEDGSDLVDAPAEAPATEVPTPPDLTAKDPSKDVPAIIPDSTESVESPKEMTEAQPTESTEMTSAEADELIDEPKADEATEISTATPTDVTTPNPLESSSKKPEDSTPFLSTKMPYDARRLNHYKSHWVSTFGWETMKYDIPFAPFAGEKKNFSDRTQELHGARFGFGGQVYLGAGFFTTSTLEVFYLGTLFTKKQEAGPQIEDQQVNFIKRTSGFQGGDISQKLGYIFEWRTKNPFMDEWSNLTFEPFVEAGIGMGQAYNSVKYAYDTGGGINGTDERYKSYVRDNLRYGKFGGGFNITGGNGFFMQARVMVNTFDITERKIRYNYRNEGSSPVIQPNTKIDDAKMDPQTVITLGGGYKF